MKKGRAIACVAVFALVFVLTIAYLQPFTAAGSPSQMYGDWDSCEAVSPDGGTEAFELFDAVPALEAGGFFRFSQQLPEKEQAPVLYGPDGYLIFEVSPGEITVLLDGQELLRTHAADLGQEQIYEQMHLPLPADAAGKTLTMLYRPDGEPPALFPPVVRASGDNYAAEFYTLAANAMALPAGAYALGFLLLTALFLTGLAIGAPDWSLPALALVAGLAAVRQLNISSGALHPMWLRLLLRRTGIQLVPAVLLAIYLTVNRKRAFWRQLGRITLFTAVLLAVWYALSLPGLIAFPRNIIAVVGTAVHGVPQDLLDCLADYLLVACSGIAVWAMVTNLIRMRSEQQALTMNQMLILQKYGDMEQDLRRTADMRHDWKNRVAALHLLARQGDMDGLNHALELLDHQLEQLSPKQYSRHLVIDTILRSAAAKAEEANVRFTAAAPVPETLEIEVEDLCTFLLNMLDNAVAAAAAAPPERREVDCAIRVNQGYLAIKCENGYDGTLAPDGNGRLQTTKPDGEGHGYGLAQMRAVARRYGDVLDVSYTNERFTVQAALKLRG